MAHLPEKSPLKFPPKVWITAALVVIATASLYAWLIPFIDDTNFGTANGLWKSQILRQYLAHPIVDYAQPPDGVFYSNFLYLPNLRLFISLLPAPFAEWPLLQQMALFNAGYGGLALGFFLLAVYTLLGDFRIACTATAFHAAMGIFLTLSTISEDIMCGYAWFLCFCWLIFAWLKTEKRGWFIAAAIAFTVSWLFHWTLMLPALPAVLVMFLAKYRRIRPAATQAGIFIAVMLGMTLTVASIAWANVFKMLNQSGKIVSGILGFSGTKGMMTVSGMAQYVLGGFQFNGTDQLVETIIETDWYRWEFVFGTLTWILCICGAVVWFRKKQAADTAQRSAWALLATVWVAGTLINAYEAGTDLQLLVQPMCFVPFGFAALLKLIDEQAAGAMRRSVITLSVTITAILLAGWIGVHNVRKFRLDEWRRGQDSRYRAQLDVVAASVGSFGETFFVTRGWDEFRTWAFSEWGMEFKENAVAMVDFLRLMPQESDADATLRFKAHIEAQLAAGKQVVAGPDLIDRDLAEVIDLFTAFQQPGKVESVVRMIRTDFSRRPLVHTEFGTFYELFPKE